MLVFKTKNEAKFALSSLVLKLSEVVLLQAVAPGVYLVRVPEGVALGWPYGIDVVHITYL